MGLVPSNFPDLLAARGLRVNVMGDWMSCGGSADHDAVVLHHTASGTGVSPADDAAYCHHGTSSAPLYNVLVGRDGSVWLLSRNKTNSSGNISSVALNEALRGQAGCTSAGARGLRDDTSANQRLFAVCAQNNGVGEPWSSALVNAMAQVSAVALQCLGIASPGYLTQHRVLTARKIDCCGDSCPYDFQPLVANALSGGGGVTPKPPEVEEMWTVVGEVPVGEGRGDKAKGLLLALPTGRKSAKLQMYCPTADTSGGVSLWAAQCLNGKKFGLWSGGNVWEQWLTGCKPFLVDVMPEAYAIQFSHMGGGGKATAPLTVSVSGT